MRAYSKQSGFTLIEMIVSLGVFSVVITIAVGALLVLIATNQQLQAEQSVMTNLSFALDSMTREIRTGTRYFCDSRTNVNAGDSPQVFRDGDDLDDLDDPATDSYATRDCPDGIEVNSHRVQGVAFVEGGNSISGASGNRIMYFYNNTDHTLYRKVGDGDAQSIVSAGLYINHAEFFVTGSAPQSDGGGNDDQPAVTIYIEAAASDAADEKLYYIQTTITQRTLDI